MCWGGCSIVALSGCCAPMLPLRGCRVSMRALGCRWEGETGSAGHKSITWNAHISTSSSTCATLSPHGGGVVFSSWSSDVAVKHIHIIAHAGGRQGRGGKAKQEKGAAQQSTLLRAIEGLALRCLGCGQGNDSRKTYVLHSKARWQRKLLHHPAPDAPPSHTNNTHAHACTLGPDERP